MTFHAILYVCALATNHSACNIETAVSVSQGPPVANELMCVKSGEAVMAASNFVAPRAGLEYLKISCARTDDRA